MEEDQDKPKVSKDSRKEDIQEWLFTKIGNSLNLRGKGTIESFSKKILGKEENK